MSTAVQFAAHRLATAWCTVLAAALTAGACFAAAPGTQPADAARPQPVGMRLVHYEDTTRRAWTADKPRPLATVLWYPAPAGTRESPWSVAIFDAGVNAIDAPLAATPARLPLIVLSHGTGGAAATLAWLAEALASHGYLVAAVNHHGNTAFEPEQRLEGQLIWWDRPRDVSVVIDRLLADPMWGPRIDATRIGVAGFSLGGYTALAAVGARLSQTQWDEHCATHPQDSPCKLPPEAADFTLDQARRLLTEDNRTRAASQHLEDSQSDPRIKAAFAIAPVLGPLMTRDSLRAIHVPVRVVVGERDDQSVPALNAEVLREAVPDVHVQVLPGVTHYTFLAPCNWRGRLAARGVCVDPDGVDRRAVHQAVAAQALAHFEQALRPVRSP
jgi:predicted dienelactone hydrolase